MDTDLGMEEVVSTATGTTLVTGIMVEVDTIREVLVLGPIQLLLVGVFHLRELGTEGFLGKINNLGVFLGVAWKLIIAMIIQGRGR